VIFDVLAPDGIGERADLTTTPPARTLTTPGATTALNNAERVEVQLLHKTGHILRPALIASIIAKACATTIAVRSNPDRDWSDAAFLLSLVSDPIASARNLSSGDRRRLRRLTPLLADDHPAWKPLGRERRRIGVATLEFILDS
jgi:hypothetical protein